jgi:hypothetical protein
VLASTYIYELIDITRVGLVLVALGYIYMKELMSFLARNY